MVISRSNSKLLNRIFAGEQLIATGFEFYEVIVDAKIEYSIAKLTGIDTINKIKILEFHTEAFALDKHNIEAIKNYSDYEDTQFDILKGLYCFSRVTVPFYSRVMYKILLSDTRIKSAIIGIIIERYRLKYHKLPKTLEELVPEFLEKLPNDPFTQQTFRYVVGDIELSIPGKNDNIYVGTYKRQISHDPKPVTCIKRPGWMIYSYGENLKDDNGIEYIYPNYDIPFRCVRE